MNAVIRDGQPQGPTSCFLRVMHFSYPVDRVYLTICFPVRGPFGGPFLLLSMQSPPLPQPMPLGNPK
jgi:hypothetical protein